MDWTREATDEEIKVLIEKYWQLEDGTLQPGDVEHRFDPFSSKLLYSLVREYKPTSCLEFGIGEGGSARVTLKALKKNGKKFKFVGSESMDQLLDKARTLVLSPYLDDQVKLVGKLEDSLRHIPKELDFIFIDPDWDEEITKWWWKNLMPRFKDGALVQIHDWSVLHNPDGLKYTGGSFPGIHWLIKKYEEKDWPFQKIFSVWDHEEYRNMSIASSFWIYRSPK